MRLTFSLSARLVAVFSAALLAGAYYFQYVEGLWPCLLCLYQRPPHFAVIVLAMAAALLAGRAPQLARIALALAAVALIAGAAIGIYHAGVEWKFWPGPSACGGGGPISANPEELAQRMAHEVIVRCDEAAWSLLGLSMAAWNALLSLAVAAFALITALRFKGRNA